jgi:ABC-type phosphate/phosphonate transport system substrate-binding protein
MKKFSAITASALAVLMLAGCGAGAEESAESDSESATAECPAADTADMTAITQERADMLIGFTESDAESCALSLGWAFRVGERDGEGFALTADYSQQRVTVSVTNDLVTAVVIG